MRRSRAMRSGRGRGDADDVRLARHVGRVAARTGEPRSEVLHALHAGIGNRGVARLLAAATGGVIQRDGPEPSAEKPGSPIEEGVLGHTTVDSSPLPSFHVQVEQGKDGMKGTIASVNASPVSITSKFVSEGLHPMTDGPDGTKRQLLVKPDIADVVKKGEQEHSDDYWWAHELIAGEAVRALNALSRQPAKAGADVGAVNHTWRAALHDEISPKLRVGADESDPRQGGSVTSPWMAAKAKLHQVSLDRDDPLKWHTMTMRAATPGERKAHETELTSDTTLVVAVEGGQIGQHPSQERIQKAFDGLPDRA